MRNAYLAMGMLALLGASAATAQAPAPRDPLVQAGTTQKISPHVFIIPDQSVPGVPNVGIIVGTRAALVVDTGLGERNGKTVLTEARLAASGRTPYLVTTHIHPEHDLGASAFPAETKMIRSNDQVKEIADTGMASANNFASRSAIMAELLKGAAFRKADITFDKDYTLDLGGGVKARIIAMGSNHTRGDTAIFVEGDNVLFSGDVAMKGPPGFNTSTTLLSHWLDSLDRLEALKPRIIVPSHGPTGDVSIIAGYRAYFTAIQTAAAAAKKRGETVDDAVKSVSAQLQAQYPEAGARMAGVIRAAYAEAH